jgi:hypothetical protein
VTPRAEEGFLRDVLRRRRIGDDRQRQAVDPSLKAAHEGRRGFTVSCGQPG